MKYTDKKRMRILLFEDNYLLRSTLYRLMRDHRWEVISYPDPEGCPLRFAEKCTCNRAQVCADVIVTDLEMPRVDGFTFVHDLLEVGCRVPFLAMFTACEDEARLEKARELGFAVFSKYDGLEPLLEWLHKVEKQVDAGRVLSSRALVFKH